MKRKIAFALAAVMIGVLALGSMTAMASTWTDPNVYELKQFETTDGENRIRISSTYGTIQNAKTSNANVFTVVSASAEGVVIYGNQIGTATLTITSATNEDDHVELHTGTITVNVVTGSNAAAEAAKTYDMILARETSAAYTGATWFQVVNITTTDSNIVTGTRSVSNDMEGVIVVAGTKKGDAKLTVHYRESSGGGIKTHVIPVKVVQAGDPLLAAASPTPAATTAPATAAPAATPAPTAAPASSKTGTETEGIYMTPRNTTAVKGKSYYANVRIDGAKVSRSSDQWETLRWVSSDTSVLTVNSQTGKFKAVAAGTVNLICVYKDGTGVDAITITIK